MSFHWNLSSDDEDEEQGLEELWKKAHEDQNKELEEKQQEDTDGATFSFDDILPSGPGPAVAKLPSSGFNDFEDGGDSSVDWEDAEEEDGGGSESNNACDIAIANTKKQPLRTITVDLDQKQPAAYGGDDTKKRQKIARKRYRHSILPNHLQSLLDNLHKTHLLALTSHALFHSSQCSDELLLSIAHSMIPPAFLWDNIPTGDNGPTLSQLRAFCDWFLELVNNAEERRQLTLRANQMAGAPQMARRATRRKRNTVEEQTNASTSSLGQLQAVSSTRRLLEYCSYLAMTQSEDPQVWESSITAKKNEWTSADKVGLLISMARSMGFRARYAVAIEPAKKDLDMHHPIFQSATINVFQALSTWNRPTKKLKKGKAEVIEIDDDEPPQEEEEEEEKPTKKQKRGPRLSDTKEENPPNHSFHRDLQILASGGDNLLVGWVEILCDVTNVRLGGRKRPRGALKDDKGSTSKPAMRWVHIDPHLEAIDDPGCVESYLFELQQQREGQPSIRKGLKKRSSGGGSARKRKPVAYVVAVEHCDDDMDSRQQKRITDVTPRYASSMVETMKLRGITPKQQAKLLSNQVSTWWSNTIKALNVSFKGTPTTPATKNSPGNNSQQSGKTIEAAIDVLSDDDASTKDNSNSGDAHDEEEDAAESLEREELAKSVKKEAIPTSKEKLKNHPLYVIPSVLKKTELLSPDAKKRIRGIFKGEMVYSRSDVSEALAEKKWLYQGRKVRKNELKKPAMRVKARSKASKGGAASFKALSTYGVGKENDGSAASERKQLENATKPLDDGMQDLYAIWQTDPWSPPSVAPGDPIPVNEYKNVELELLNPGLAHIPEPGIAPVAKQLGIPYAPCLLGFEGHNGNRTPNIRGIVVHNHNAELLREASVEVVSRNVEQEHEKRRKAVYSRWKRLLVGILTQDRLEREYGD